MARVARNVAVTPYSVDKLFWMIGIDIVFRQDAVSR